MTTTCNKCRNEIEIKTVPIQTVRCDKCGAEMVIGLRTPDKGEG